MQAKVRIKSNVTTGLTGIWQSTYSYPNRGLGKEFSGKHLLRLRRDGNHLIFESLPLGNESYVIIRLTIDGNVASGSWQEATNPGGYYKGALYYGVIQLFIVEGGKEIRGKWLGYDEYGEINSGPWELSYVGESIPEKQQV